MMNIMKTITRKNKDLLLKDLCTRLPYGVKVQCLSHQIPLKILSINPNGVTWLTGDKGYPFEVDWKDCKPYLFPLSSMTRAQEREWQSLMVCDIYGIFYHTIESFDYLYKNHIDIRGLIPMCLANDATGLNIY